MKTLFLLTFLVLFTSCSSPVPKNEPAYKGTDPRLQEYKDEFMELAVVRGIVFNRDVTMGFANTQSDASGGVIGICTYGHRWREIDIDEKFFKSRGYLQTKALIFHELTHCYCNRNHTYGSKTRIQYPDGIFEKIIEKLRTEIDETEIPETERPYFEDGCARTLMHPVVVSSTCMFNHYDHYVDEMFNNCRVW